MTNGQQHITFADLEILLTNLTEAEMDNSTRAALQRARRALLQQTPPGRPQMNDDAALRKISELKTTTGCSFHAAAKKVARELRPFAPNHEAIAERYRRKDKKGSTK